MYLQLFKSPNPKKKALEKSQININMGCQSVKGRPMFTSHSETKKILR